MMNHRMIRPTSRVLIAICAMALTALVLSLSATIARAQEHATEPPTAAPAAHDEAAARGEKETVDRPSVSVDPTWAGVMVIIILGMFVMAAAVGPIMRSEMPEEVPVPHGHDEVVGHEAAHGHDPHHGHGHGHGH